MRTTVKIQNLKCDSCKNAVAKKMLSVKGITDVIIDLDRFEVSFNYTTHNALEGLREELYNIGYPITKDPNRIIDNVA